MSLSVISPTGDRLKKGLQDSLLLDRDVYAVVWRAAHGGAYLAETPISEISGKEVTLRQLAGSQEAPLKVLQINIVEMERGISGLRDVTEDMAWELRRLANDGAGLASGAVDFCQREGSLDPQGVLHEDGGLFYLPSRAA